MIKKWKSFLEANYTAQSDEKNLKKYFDITSEDIKDWCQEFLDEFTELDFEVSVVNQNLFIVNFYEVDYESRIIMNRITKEKYPFPKDVLQFLKDRLNDYDCYLLKNKTAMDSDVYYPLNKKYLSLHIFKRSYS